MFDDVDDVLDALELLLNQTVKQHIPLKQRRVKKPRALKTADQRSMIGRKLFLIGEEATLPFILIGKKYI